MAVGIVGEREIPSLHNMEVTRDDHLHRFADKINESRVGEGLPPLDHGVIVECDELARLATDEARARIDELLES